MRDSVCLQSARYQIEKSDRWISERPGCMTIQLGSRVTPSAKKKKKSRRKLRLGLFLFLSQFNYFCRRSTIFVAVWTGQMASCQWSNGEKAMDRIKSTSVVQVVISAGCSDWATRERCIMHIDNIIGGLEGKERKTEVWFGWRVTRGSGVSRCAMHS